ncbi:MAG TPA: DUF1822 family protein [Allocoleopsis sp.]
MADYTMIREKFILMPITHRAIETARQFSAQQLNPQEAEQVYLNTLAVWAVNDYLTLLEFDTDLKQSDCWHPVLRLCVDVADIQVKGLGKLECRPVKVSRSAIEDKQPLPSQPIQLHRDVSEREATPLCLIPPEVWCDRIGYIVVGIDEDAKEAILLGFSPTAGTGELCLSQLQSMDALIRHLDHLAQLRVNLSQWMLNRFEAGWQQVESLFDTEPESSDSSTSSTSGSSLGQWFHNTLDRSRQAIANLFSSESDSQLQFQEALNFRHPEAANVPPGKARTRLFPEADVTRAKLIDLGMQFGTKSIALLVALTQECDRKVSILVQVHPASDERYLPPHLKLVLLSELGEALQEVESRGQDLCIQLRQFKARPGTCFDIQVALDDVSIKESFAI